jgi:hypothetical protein
MKFDRETLYSLLPAIYRVRDAEQGYPLQALLGVMAEQIAVLEEDLAQLYDDQFIETCAEWVVPYLGDLLGYRPLNQLERNQLPARRSLKPSERAQVANTIAYRRRKGTAAVLEQLARDVTGWEANVVEYFQRLVTSQHLNHLRPGNQAPNLRAWRALELAPTPFNSMAHSADVRRIDSRRGVPGRFNIPNVGIFLWRLEAYPVTCSPAPEFDNRRYRFHPLGYDIPLYSEPKSEESISQLATHLNVALPISRRLMAENLDLYYGDGKSLGLYRKIENSKEQPYKLIAAERITIRNLQGWSDVSRLSADKYAIDPVLGRFTRPPNSDRAVFVSFHFGFSANLGGGSYDRRAQILATAENSLNVPKDQADVLTAVANLTDQITNDQSRVSGLVNITDNDRYDVKQPLELKANQSLTLQAANECWPHLVLGGGEWLIKGEPYSELTLSGLLLSGGTLRVSGKLRRLRLSHCTLVPGLALSWDGKPVAPDQPSLIVESSGTEIELEHCLVGGLRIDEDAAVMLRNSIVDATSQAGIAYAAPDEVQAGGKLHLENCTVIGRVHTRLLEMASNTIFLAQTTSGEAPVRAIQRQAGCVRYSYVPPGSETPHRYLRQPRNETQATQVQPHFTSLQFGQPGYCQLRPTCPREIWRGADDEAEMGAFHDLYQPQREANLRIRLEEYLRFGLEAGIFYAS